MISLNHSQAPQPRTNENRVSLAVKLVVKAVGAVAVGAFAGFVWGANDVLDDFNFVEQTTAIQSKVDVPPIWTDAEYLNEQVFAGLDVAVATSAVVHDSWQATIIAGIAVSGQTDTPTTYNHKLTSVVDAATKTGAPLDLTGIDIIKIKGALGETVEQKHYPSAKRMVDRTDEEKNDPNMHRIMELTVSPDDLIFTPVVNPNIFDYAGAFVTPSNPGVEFANIPDWLKTLFGGNEQEFKQNRAKLAESSAYVKAVSTAIDKCMPVVMNSTEISPWVKKAIQIIVVKNYNRTRTPDEHISTDDVLVTIQDIDPKIYQSPWTKEMIEKSDQAISAASQNGGTLIISSTVDTSTECSISEAGVLATTEGNGQNG